MNTDRFFSIFGKVIFVIIILGVISYGSYYFGKQNIKILDQNEANTTDISNDSQNNNNNDFTTENENTVISTSKPVQKVQISAGVNKESGLSFSQYTIEIPTTWTQKRESQTKMDEKLILTNNEYEISIFQAATGGALCLYPGDGEFEGPSSKFDTFTSISTKDGLVFRRSGNVNGTAFTICQKSPDGSYQQPTSFGHISVKLPANFDSKILTEIDSIVASLKKI